jgi:RNA polymerase sigma-70 factor (ECF subfamily)
LSSASFIDQLYREEAGRILPSLIRVLGDFALAEDALQEAFRAAVQQWPRDGIPPVPRAWIIQTARHRAIDHLRRRRRFQEKTALLEQDLGGLSAILESPPAIADDQLRLVYTCCHPSLALESQVALTLRTLCGLKTEEIARAFLVPTPAMAQRIVRAQRKIRDAGIPYEIPGPSELPERTRAVLTTIYLTFNEGYSATGGDSPLRVDLCEEAIRLGRVGVTILSAAFRAEAIAMLSLMIMHHARRAARIAPDGGLVLLDQQDRSLWRKEEAEEGIALLREALSLGARGPYAIQAAIAALHLEAATPAETDWAQIVGLYDRLLAVDPSPVVALNRAAAVAMAEGAERGLAQIDDLAASGSLRGYHLLSASRADLLRRLGRFDEAAAAYRDALALTRNEAERRFLEARLVEVSPRRAGGHDEGGR